MRNTLRHSFLILALTALATQAFAGDLLPALSPQSSVLSENKLAQDPTTGVIQLQFSNAIANTGVGQLQLVAYRSVDRSTIDLNNDTIPAYQRIYRDNGSSYDLPVGQVIYHPEHHHFHFDGAAKYQLIDPSTGEVLKESPKVSFCLADVATVSPAVPGTPIAPVYNSCAHDPFAGYLQMGISVGWMDIYGEDLIGQAFDVSDLMQLPAKTYLLRSTTNPLGLLREANQANPVSVEIQVRIGVGVKVVPGKSRPGV